MRPVRILTIVLMFALLVCNALWLTPVATAADGQQTVTPITARGTGQIDDLNPGANIDLSKPDVIQREAKEADTPTVPVPAGEPAPSKNNPVTTSNSGFFGFNGINHADQRLAGTGIYTNTQFSLEPPDQALCVGNGYVLESVNLALQVHKTDGSKVGVTTALNQFFGLAPGINRTTLVQGDFLSDPKCYYDVDSGHWFLTVLQQDPPPSPRTHVEIAVSKTNNPAGQWYLYSIDTTDDGTMGTVSHPNCPCLPDQPLIGADDNGFYISTNEYENQDPFRFNGAQIYAMSKFKLINGTLPTVVQIDAGLVGGVKSESVQPATTAPGARHNRSKGGTEYFMSSLFSEGHSLAYDNRIAVWELVNTSSLYDPSPRLKLHNVVIHSITYGGIVNSDDGNGSFAAISAEQKPGPASSTPFKNTYAPTQPLERLNMNDDRMNQVVFAQGELWGGVNTALKTKDGSTRVGIAYFIVQPEQGDNNDPNGGLHAEMVKQGYVSVNGNNVMFPSIGVTKQGRAVMCFTLVGPNYFPSAAYTAINDDPGDHSNTVIHVAAAGAGPDDGFTGYNTIFAGGNGVARWGDYSAAVADEDGNIWMANEYISGAPRTLLANWATFISKINPRIGD